MVGGVVLLVGLGAGVWSAHLHPSPPGPTQPIVVVQTRADERYPYRSAVFDAFVEDSYREVASRVEPFYAWWEGAYARHPQLWLEGHKALIAAMEARKKELAAAQGEAKTRLELETARWLHKLVKTLIPKFSLERGFEFVYTVERGERQCLLQSVLIAGMLQKMGLDAGVAMVWKNPQAQESNNGHAVTVLRLPGGRDVLVDASDPEPFIRHQGLFVYDPASRSYRFVEPVYSQDFITAYRLHGSGEEVNPNQLRPLSARFLRSQFYYYRGERAPGGFMGPSNPRGLAASARFLEQAIRYDPYNPLPVYVLGHVYAKEGKKEAAREQYLQGYRLYRAFGYVPSGPQAAYSRAGWGY
ncbi:hypothetical protein EWH23_09100 [Meiothermus sp. PNK-Is4]|nr:hypothetical protein DNA98_12090 [Meiothermus sp. Pnk-1]RYM36677.1 hypothetical protein EWH23_09100 [Meiothermus sp. PNK-Is4]